MEKNKIKPKSLKEFMELAAKMPPDELKNDWICGTVIGCTGKGCHFQLIT